MKKVLLLLAILCANTLYGMKRAAGEHYVEADIRSELRPEIWGQLPSEVKALIMVALAQSGGNLDEAVNNIKKVSVLNKRFNQIINEAYSIDNLQGFTQLVHILAEKFGTPVARKYIQLGHDLLISIYDFSSFSIKKFEEYIKNGADVNYSSPSMPEYEMTPGIKTPMFFAMRQGKLEVIQLLLDSGVTLKSDEYYDTYKYWTPLQKETIKQLLDKERAKRLKKESL